MKLDFVIPRYGPVGGAENAVGALARRSQRAGLTVNLHTTCAHSSNSWDNAETPGETFDDSLAFTAISLILDAMTIGHRWNVESSWDPPALMRSHKINSSFIKVR